MELEFIIAVITIVIAVNIVAIGYYQANKDEIATPLEFFRIKVNQANVCLSCDNIYHSSEQWCPLCFEREFFPLRDAFPILILPQDVKKEVDKDGKIHYTLSLVGKEKCGFGPESDFNADKFAKYSDLDFGKAQTSEQRGFAEDYSIESFKSEVGRIYNHSRVRMEFKCGVI